MTPFAKCPVCGGEMIAKKVEKLLKAGNHVAVVTVKAEVCTHCGERLYSKKTITRFGQIREKLRKQDLNEFQPLGQSFRVA
ncbi:YgiT-type zinc finger protein [candidate division KSB1 bacterium]|nr:YgiT-type zinc finger protein [candidate division KSB1 bacterium]